MSAAPTRCFATSRPPRLSWSPLGRTMTRRATDALAYFGRPGTTTGLRRRSTAAWNTDELHPQLCHPHPLRSPQPAEPGAPDLPKPAFPAKLAIETAWAARQMHAPKRRHSAALLHPKISHRRDEDPCESHEQSYLHRQGDRVAKLREKWIPP